jgi:hypothetical protein
VSSCSSSKIFLQLINKLFIFNIHFYKYLQYIFKKIEGVQTHLQCSLLNMTKFVMFFHGYCDTSSLNFPRKWVLFFVDLFSLLYRQPRTNRGNIHGIWFPHVIRLISICCSNFFFTNIYLGSDTHPFLLTWECYICHDVFSLYRRMFMEKHKCSFYVATRTLYLPRLFVAI